MPTLNINGTRVTVGDEFLKLPLEQQNATVDEIAKSLGNIQKQMPEQSQQPETATLGHKIGATIDGVAQGMTFGFSDEIAAGLGSGFGMLGDYQQKLEQERARMDENKRLAGGYELAGELGGGLATAGGLAAKGATLLGKKGLSLTARMGRGAAEGAAYGAAYGAGTAESGVGDRAKGAVTGAMMGGAIGGATPAIGAGLRGLGGAVYDQVSPAMRAITNPSKEAVRRVGAAVERDSKMAQRGLSAADEAIGAVDNVDIRNFDRGGETTRALARSVANQSPESRGVIERVVSDRFEGQGGRAKSFISNLMNGNVDDVAFQDSLRSAAANTNKGAYTKAFAYNFGPEHSMVFDDLAKRVPAQAVANAMKVAKAEGRPFGEQLIASIDEATNTVTFSRSPSMREWHYIQRGLRSAADSAYRNGAGEVGTAYKQLHREILGAMDEANPLYQKARQGAAKFFQADDALEAGRKFVNQNMNLRQAQKAIIGFNSAEKEAFKTGFAAELVEKIGKTNDRRNVVQQIFGSDAARKKIELAMGKDAAKQFESFVKVEAALDAIRGAMGNSTTARQLAELGLGAGAGYTYSGDFSGALTGAALARGARMVGAKAEERVLREVADILLSKDPAKLQRGVQMISKSNAYRKALDTYLINMENILKAPAIAGVVSSTAN